MDLGKTVEELFKIIEDQQRYIKNQHQFILDFIEHVRNVKEEELQQDMTIKWVDKDIDKLHFGISPAQLIKFGAINVFGQAITDKLMKLIGPSPDSYINDDRLFKNLLLMTGGCNENRAESFINWVKQNKKYLTI
jgi:hypothetical protein